MDHDIVERLYAQLTGGLVCDIRASDIAEAAEEIQWLRSELSAERARAVSGHHPISIEDVARHIGNNPEGYLPIDIIIGVNMELADRMNFVLGLTPGGEIRDA